MLRWYQLKLAQRPYLTQSITTAVLFATGDVMAQQGVERVGIRKHDFARTGRMTFYGGVIFGPVATTWFRLLSTHVKLGSPNTTLAARVIADQTLFAPTNLFVFLSTMAILEGKDPAKKIASTYADTMTANWTVWPLVQTLNFKFVPLEGRLLFVNFVSLGWNCYLSHIATKENKISEH